MSHIRSWWLLPVETGSACVALAFSKAVSSMHAVTRRPGLARAPTPALNVLGRSHKPLDGSGTLSLTQNTEMPCTLPLQVVYDGLPRHDAGARAGGRPAGRCGSLSRATGYGRRAFSANLLLLAVAAPRHLHADVAATQLP